MQPTKKWLSPHPKCDFNNSHELKPWFVDGKTSTGPWALMCSDCYRNHGVGKGQRYDGITLEKVEKTSTGFDLLIGKHYQDHWFRDAEPLKVLSACPKCPATHRELWSLKKFIFAFGKIITKRKRFYVCLICLHEEEIFTAYERPKRQPKSEKKQLLQAFKSLTPAQQQKLLGG